MEVIRALYVVRNPDKACVTVEVPLIDPAIGECDLEARSASHRGSVA